jgi:hypothetical protein
MNNVVIAIMKHYFLSLYIVILKKKCKEKKIKNKLQKNKDNNTCRVINI